MDVTSPRCDIVHHENEHSIYYAFDAVALFEHQGVLIHTSHRVQVQDACSNSLKKKEEKKSYSIALKNWLHAVILTSLGAQLLLPVGYNIKLV